MNLAGLGAWQIPLESLLPLPAFLFVLWRIAALAMVTSPTNNQAEADNEDTETIVATKLPLRQMTAIL